MDKNLLRTNNYCVFTFGSTSHALKAETCLNNIEASFIIIPTLREISASCGLSIKMYCDDMESYYNTLQEHSIQVDAVYSVKKNENKLELEKLVAPSRV
jgi:hypothetical protein